MIKILKETFKNNKKKHFNFGFDQEELSYSDIVILSINFDINLHTKNKFQ